MRKITQAPSGSTIYFWNICGNVGNAINSVVLLLLVTRILGKTEGDIFSLAWAIGQLALIVGVFQARIYQATDVTELYKFKQYFTLRIISCSAMCLYSVLYVLIKGYSHYEMMIILLVCFTKVVDAFSDVYGGWYQQKERLDLAGKAMSFRILFSMIAFAIILFVSHNLLLSCVGMLIVSILCFFAYDYRYYLALKTIFRTRPDTTQSKWMLHLISTCIPLFINGFLIITIFNAPKMAIDDAMRTGLLEQGSQTYYNILFMPASVMNLIFIIFRPMITQMAIEWNRNKYKRFLKIALNIFLYLTGISVVVILCGWLLGIPVLSFVYGVDLSAFRSCLVILIIGGGVNTFVNVLDNALTVIRYHHVLSIAYIVTWIYSTVITPVFVNRMGIQGASYSFLTSMIVLLVCTSVIFLICVRLGIKKEKAK